MQNALAKPSISRLQQFWWMPGETVTELHFRITAKTGKLTAAIKRLNLIFIFQIRREQSTGAHSYAVCDRHPLYSEVAFSGI